MPRSRTCWPNAPWWSQIPPYRPGQFYLREPPPPLRVVLHGLTGLGLLMADGYADLDPGGRPGRAAHAHPDFGVPVIGVAKSRLRTATHAVPVLRGSSARPLFISAAGMPAVDAAELVRRVTGRRRLPDALRRSYTLARAGPPTVRMTDRRPAWPTHMCGQASYSHVDHGYGTGPSVSVDGRRLFREPETVAVQAPCHRHLRASPGHGSRASPNQRAWLGSLHPTISATRIECVSHWLQLKLMARRLAWPSPSLVIRLLKLPAAQPRGRGRAGAGTIRLGSDHSTERQSGLR